MKALIAVPVRSARLSVAGLIVVLALATLGVPSAWAATMTVNSTTDAVDANPGDGVCATAAGECTLRAAVQEANARPGPDTITLPMEFYHLDIVGAGEDAAASGDLDITDDLTITGVINSFGYRPVINGATRFGQTNDRIFHVIGATVQLNNLAMGAGFSTHGGGILNEGGTLTLSNCQLWNNASINNGGAIYNGVGATLTLDGSQVQSNEAGASNGGISAIVSGGAIYNLGVAAVTNNTFIFDNQASRDGGGIYNGAGGQLTIDNSELQRNEAQSNGGGVFNLGALVIQNGAFIWGNHAVVDGGGIFNGLGGDLTVDGSHIYENGANGNGGGIYSVGITLIRNASVIGEPGSSGGSNNAALGGGIYTDHNTLTIDNSTVAGNGATLKGGGIYQGGDGLYVPGSTILLIRNSSLVSDNQAPYGGALYNHRGEATIQSSFVTANTAAEGAGIYNDVDGVLTLDDVDVSSHTTAQWFWVDEGIGGGLSNYGTAIVGNGSRIRNNTVGWLGGGIYNGAGTLTLNASSVSGNAATVSGSGGGLFNATGNVIIQNGSTIGQNNTAALGGGISNNIDANITVSNSDIWGNTATGYGGGILNYGTLTMSLSRSGSNTGSRGGGIYNGNLGNLTIGNQTSIIGNIATDSGGGIYNLENVTVDDSILIGNQAANDGGGLHNAGGNATIQNGSIIGGGTPNTATNGGGIASDYGADLTIASSTIAGNTATSRGGGVYNGQSNAVIANSVVGVITPNVADEGGGIYNGFYGSLVTHGSTIAGNTATIGGGVVSAGTLVMTNSTVSGNRADDGAGGIGGWSGSVDLNNVTVAANYADANNDGIGDGGGLSLSSSASTFVRNTILADNTDRNPSGSTPDCYTYGGFTSGGYNLIEAGDLCSAGLLATDITGSDPRLGSLSNNGGPTPTQPLLLGSPATDAGSPAVPGSGGDACEVTDQRGVPRPGGPACDIGAYEVPANTPTGTDVTIPLFDQTTGQILATVRYTNVNQAGYTALSTYDCAAPSPPTGFMLGDPPLCFDLSTTAQYTPPVLVCVIYSGYTFTDESSLVFYHYDETLAAWVQVVPTLWDTTNDFICGYVDSFSPFGVFEVIPNQPPVANTGGPYAVDEGATVELTGSGEDADGDTLAFDWDLDGDGTFESSGQTVVFDATDRDGPDSQAVTLRVCDASACTTASTTAEIANVAPTVDAGPDAALIAGQVFASSGSFSDPAAADTFSATVDYGDESGVQTLVLNGQTFSLQHLYGTPGTYTVAVVVTDDDGDSGSGSASVMVLSLEEAAANIIGQVGQLMQAGSLNKGQARSLIAKLEAAIDALGRGNTKAATQQLEAFANQVQAFVNGDMLTAEEAQPLLNAATSLLALLES